jgi:uncharacterized protein
MGKMNLTMDMEISFNPITSTAEALFELGMKNCVANKFVEAHKWFNIAALKGSIEARFYRCDISREMSTADIAEAQRQARAILTVH